MKDVELFPKRVGPRILSLESVYYFGTIDYVTSVVENKNNLLSKTDFDGETNWSGIVNFHCMQKSLVMSMRFILFSAMIEMTRYLHQVSLSFVYLHTFSNQFRNTSLKTI